MKLLLVVAILLATVTTTGSSFADDQTEITILPGASVPGCETSDTCLSDSRVSVSIGDTVTWLNDDTAAHMLASGNALAGVDGFFSSDLLAFGQEFSVTFEDPGNFEYFCLVHPWKEGEIIVTGIRDDNLPKPDPEPDNKGNPEIEALRNHIKTLENENDRLQQELEQKELKIELLEEEIQNLNLLIREQIKIIWEWIQNR